MARYQCSACFFPYDELNGLPDEGIPAGTPFEDVDPAWHCPDCGNPKSSFIEYAA